MMMAASGHLDFICGETLAVQIDIEDHQDSADGYEAVQSVQIDDMDVLIALRMDGD